MSSAPSPTTEPPIDLPALEKTLLRPRTFISASLSWLVGIMTVVAMLPLLSVLVMLLVRGGQRLSLALFTELPPPAGVEGGGFGNAIAGTLVMVLIASLISVPFGIMAAVYLAEYAGDSKAGSIIRFAAKVLTGLPSILAGVFAFAAVVLTTGHPSAVAGGIALSVLMLPIVVLAAEEAIRMVPHRMREAAVGMGATKTQVVLRVVLPTASPGVLTAVMLAVARAAGETAPLLFTAWFSYFWLSGRIMEPTASMAVLIFNYSTSPFDNQKDLAWACSLILVLLVLVVNVIAQVLSARSVRK